MWFCSYRYGAPLGDPLGSGAPRSAINLTMYKLTMKKNRFMILVFIKE